MKPDNDQPKVTLEQLLRVKRAEKPSPEFWAQFERELRVKQLAAIVEPRPWWAPFIRVGSRLARYQMPVGAAAVVALTLLTVRQYDTATSPGAGRSLVPQVATEKVEKRGLTLAASADVAAKAEAPASLAANASELAGGVPRAHRASSVGSQALGAGAMLGGAASGLHAEASDETDARSVAARMVAANLEVVKTSEPELVPLLELSLASQTPQPAGKVAAVAARDPLSQVGAEAAQKRSNRLLGSALPATATVVASSASSSTLRLNRSISEERIYDSMRRGRLNAERVPIKF